MGRVRALEALLAARRDGSQEAGDIGGGQAEALRPEIMMCVKSWQTPLRMAKALAAGVEGVGLARHR